jgi:glycosyltransferase involved in cell wall biosynthesis
MMTPSPAVSVVLPVYNGATYLALAIESVLDQTFRDFELLLLDDGSRDGTLGILQHYAALDVRCKVFSRANRGIVSTLNEGVERARGDVVCRMDADDVALPTRFERQVDHLARNPNCVLVATRALLIDPEGFPLLEMSDCLTHDQIDVGHLRGRGSVIFHPTIAMRRQAVLDAGGYRAEFEWAEDYDLFLRLAEVGRVECIDEVLMQYRQHSSSVGYSKRELQRSRMAAALAAALVRRGVAGDATAAVEDPPAPLPGLADIHRKWAWWALKGRNIRSARKHAWRALCLAPLDKENRRVLACALRGR